MGILSALSRRRLLGGAGAITLIPAAPSTASDSIDTTVAATREKSREEFVLDLVAIVAPSSGGEWQPITGGRFAGPRLSGEVLPGGTLRVVSRQDGLHAVDASCTLRTLEGSVITLAAHALMPADESAADSLRAVPAVDAPAGAHDWLNRALLVGTLDTSRRTQGRVSLRVDRLA